MVRWCLVNFQCRGFLLIWIKVGKGHIALAAGAGDVIWTFFSLVYLFSFLSSSLGYGPIRRKYCLKESNYQPNPVVSGIKTSVHSCYHICSTVSDKNACQSIDSDLTTHSTILDSISRRFVVVGNLHNSFPAGSFPRENWLHFFRFSSLALSISFNFTLCSASLHFVNRPCSDHRSG